MNPIFVFFIAGAAIAAALSGRMAEVSTAVFESAKNGVTVAFGLIGAMVLFLGMINVLRDAGAVSAVARGLYPLLGKLFPDIPRGHPALGAIVMNFAANIFGLGNAATPLGLKAMQELDRLNPHKGVATNSMALFLAINTSGISVLPLGVVAVRASLGSHDPSGIIVPTLLATLANTLAAVPIAILLSRLPAFRPERFVQPDDSAPANTATPSAPLSQTAAPLPDAAASLVDQPAPPGGGPWARALAWGGAAVLALAVLDEGVRRTFGTSPLAALRPPAALPPAAADAAAAAGSAAATALPVLSVPAPDADFGSFLLALPGVLADWLIPLFLAFVVLYGIARGVKVYESAIKGAREGFDIFVMIVPFLVMVLVGVGVFRASGGLDLLLGIVAPVTSLIGFPPEALPMALIRPLSGSGAMGVMTETMTTYGPDSFVGYLVSVINGTSETTFYVLAVYFGSVRVRAVRHTLLACLCADAVGLASALLFTRLLVPAA